MPKNRNWIIVLDTETDGTDPQSANVVQLSAVPIHPISLEIQYHNTFDVIIRPDGITKLNDYLTPAIKKTIAWHAENAGCSSDDIIEKWKNGIPKKAAWESFCTYCNQFAINKSTYGLPYPAGYNIINFDMILLDRLAQSTNKKMPLSTFRQVDLMHHLFWWLENLEEPKNYKLDSVKEFFGLETHSQAHDALSDCIDTAKIISVFMKYCRKHASLEKFKGRFKNGSC